jgi:1,6-anhydro-N-acetylmuramate kinase
VRPRVEIQCIGSDDFESAGIMRGDLLDGRDCALVALDGDDERGAESQQCAREPAWARTDFEHGNAIERPRRARNTHRQIEIKQEILAERLACAQAMSPNDLA